MLNPPLRCKIKYELKFYPEDEKEMTSKPEKSLLNDTDSSEAVWFNETVSDTCSEQSFIYGAVKISTVPLMLGQ